MVLSAAVLLLAGAGTARSADVRVDAAQNVTVHGSSQSLKDVVVELCGAAGVRLVSYDAPDRSLVADYEDVPLHQLLGRLLRSESYMIGLERGDDGPRVSWLRVIGPERGGAPPPGSAPTAAVSSAASYFGMSSDVIETALSGSNALERAKATRSIIEAVKQDPDKLDAFLSRPIGTTATAIADEPFAIDLLNAIKVQQPDTGTRLKLDGIIRTIRVQQSAKGKGQ